MERDSTKIEKCSRAKTWRGCAGNLVVIVTSAKPRVILCHNGPVDRVPAAAKQDIELVYQEPYWQRGEGGLAVGVRAV